MIARPGDPTGHRRWVVACIVDAAERFGRAIGDMPRSAFEALRPNDGRDWPCSRDFQRCGGYGAIRAVAAADVDPPSMADLGERREVHRENLYRRGLERTVGDAEWQARRLREVLAEAVQMTPAVLSDLDKPAPRLRDTSECETVAFISDVHFGSFVDPLEVPGNAYNWTIAARRMALFAEQIASYKPHHRDKSTLRLLLGGDIIENELHGKGPHIDVLAEQLNGTRQIFTDLIDYLRHHYAAIHVEAVSGNHDRHSHQRDRATANKWDSLASVLYTGLAAVFRSCPDVTWNIPRTPYAVWRAPGGSHCAVTHGDTVFNGGSPGKSVNTGSLSTQLRAWNAGRAQRGEPRLDAIAIGHLHTPLVTSLDDGATLVINGCGSGTAGYAQSIGIHGSNPTQVLWESVPGYPVGDVRFVRLSPADTDARLDRIVGTPQRIGEAA